MDSEEGKAGEEQRVGDSEEREWNKKEKRAKNAKKGDIGRHRIEKEEMKNKA